MPSAHNPLTYRPDIDGLRAIAVLGVVFFHAGFSFPGGFVGVDVFFVISGFLITSLIIRDLKKGTFSMLDFWERRARRILPALAVVVAFTLAVGYFILFPAAFRALGASVISLALCSSNIQFWRNLDYFAPGTEELPLLQTWSLSVEEQFYLLIPVLLWLLFNKGISKWVFQILLIIGVLSFGLSIYETFHHADAAFYLLPSRAWQLVAGSLLAFAPPLKSNRLRNSMGWLGLLSIGLPFFFYSHKTPFPGIAALPPVVGAALLIWSGIPALLSPSTHGLPSAHRLLASRPMVQIGLLSYSLYLWHWPLLAYAHYLGVYETSVLTRVVLVVLSFVFAWLSLRYVEQPFRSRDLISSQSRVFLLSVVTTATLVLPAAWVWRADGIPSRISPRALLLAVGKEDDFFIHHIELVDIPDNLVALGTKGVEPSVFVWGDSHAMAMLAAVDTACLETGTAGLAATHAATLPALDWFDNDGFGLDEAAPAYNQAVMDYLQSASARSTINRVILVARWSGYTRYNRGKAREIPDSLRDALRVTVEELQRGGYAVSIFQEVPEWPADVPRSLAFAEHSIVTRLLAPRLTYDSEAGAEKKRLEKDLFSELQNLQPAVHFIDPLPFFCGEDGELLNADEGGVFYRDNNHLSNHGASRLTLIFVDLFSKSGATE